MDNTYKNPADMTKEELEKIVSLIIELDQLGEGEKPEVQIGLVTSIQTLIRTPEAVKEAVAEQEAEESNEEEPVAEAA